jgi:hypothetical protein
MPVPLDKPVTIPEPEPIDKVVDAVLQVPPVTVSVSVIADPDTNCCKAGNRYRRSINGQ